MLAEEKALIRKVLIVLAAAYPIGVGVGIALKLTIPVFSDAPWPELIYGPAITVASSGVLVLGVAWLANRRRR